MRSPAHHGETVKREFAKQAATFEDPDYSFADRRLIAWIHMGFVDDSFDLVVSRFAAHHFERRSSAPTSSGAWNR